MTREVLIRPVLNGFVIDVGCQRVVFTNKQAMLIQLSEYYDKPEEVEKRFIAEAVNKMSIVPLAAQPLAAQPPPMGQASLGNYGQALGQFATPTAPRPC